MLSAHDIYTPLHRPHPAAPDSLLVHIAMAPIDYIRDRMRGVEATAA